MDVGFSELWLDVNRERPCLDEGEIPIFLAPIASEQVVDLSERRMHQLAVHSEPVLMCASLHTIKDTPSDVSLGLLYYFLTYDNEDNYLFHL